MRLIAVSLILVFAPVPWLRGQSSVTLHMKNGQTLTGDLVSVGSDSIQYRLQGGTASLTQGYADVRYIEFPEPDLWIEGTDAFGSGDVQAALSAFSKLTGSQSEVTHYPAPGNYKTRAQRKLADCYRRTRNAKAVAKVLSEIEWAKLPPQDQNDVPILKLWSALGSQNRDQAAQLAKSMEAEFSMEDPDFPEFSFVLGKLAAESGAADEAIRHFGMCYGLPTPDPALAADALRENITLLAALPSREDELRALTHLYTTLCDPMGLWEGAPAEAVAAMDAELPEVAAMEKKLDFEFETVQNFRFEPNPNAPPPSKQTKKSKKNTTPSPWVATDAKFSVAENPGSWPEAETRVGKLEAEGYSGTVTRALNEEEPRLALNPGTALRVSLDVWLMGSMEPSPKAQSPDMALRFGLVNKDAAGYYLSIPAGALRDLKVGKDLGGNDQMLGGKDVAMFESAEPAPHAGLQPGSPSKLQLTLSLGGDGSLSLRASVDGVGVAALDAPKEGQPFPLNFQGGKFALRLANLKTDLLFDNVLIEAGH